MLMPMLREVVFSLVMGRGPHAQHSNFSLYSSGRYRPQVQGRQTHPFQYTGKETESYEEAEVLDLGLLDFGVGR